MPQRQEKQKERKVKYLLKKRVTKISIKKSIKE